MGSDAVVGRSIEECEQALTLHDRLVSQLSRRLSFRAIIEASETASELAGVARAALVPGVLRMAIARSVCEYCANG
jgi:hypothetical protein